MFARHCRALQRHNTGVFEGLKLSVLGSVLTPRFLSQQNGDDERLRAARKWLAQLSSQTIPRKICDISYIDADQRAPTVLRVNSKSTIKIRLSDLLPLIPAALHAHIRSSRYLADRSQTLVIQSQETRNQAQNLELCFEKLRGILADAGKLAIPGETSPEQKQKVKQLQKAENESRLRMKKAHSDKKRSRQRKRDE
ncbi:hypothetical protein FQN57_001422 [Myotisia sp. PD_48]|nr:hypothetical protein FQN57_001422 [Myotisia sp. PD_48]